MGYRSDVKLIVGTKKSEIEAKTILSWLDNKTKELFKNCFVIEADGEYERIYFSVNDFKWYDTFTEIENFNKWLDKIQDFIDANDTETYFHFIRLGENYDDMHEIVAGDPVEYIQLIRCIKFEKE